MDREGRKIGSVLYIGFHRAFGVHLEIHVIKLCSIRKVTTDMCSSPTVEVLKPYHENPKLTQSP